MCECVFDEIFVSDPNSVFQQDNACPHTARITTGHFQQNQVDVIRVAGVLGSDVLGKIVRLHVNFP